MHDPQILSLPIKRSGAKRGAEQIESGKRPDARARSYPRGADLFPLAKPRVRLHGHGESIPANQGKHLLIGEGELDVEAVSRRGDARGIEQGSEIRVGITDLIALIKQTRLQERGKGVGVVGSGADGLKAGLHAGAGNNLQAQGAQAGNELLRLRELRRFRRQLLHGQLRVGSVHHRPYHAAAIGFVDQGKHLGIAQEALLFARADGDEAFELLALAECRRIGIEKEEEQIRRSRSPAEGVERKVAHLYHRKLLRGEIAFRRFGTERADGHAQDLLAAGRRNILLRRSIRAIRRSVLSRCGRSRAHSGPGNFFHLRIGIDARGRQKLLELLEARRKHLLLQLREPAQGTRLFQIGVGELANVLREHADHVRAEATGVVARDRGASQDRPKDCSRENFSIIHLFTLEAPGFSHPNCYDSMLRNEMPPGASSLILISSRFSRIFFAGAKSSSSKSAASLGSSALRGTRPTISLPWIEQPLRWASSRTASKTRRMGVSSKSVRLVET